MKSGDVIIWQVNKPIQLETSPGSGSAPAASLATSPPSAADTAAAAGAISTAAHKAVDPAGPPADGAPASTLAHYRAVYGATQQADAAAGTAKIAAYDAASKTAATPSGTAQAIKKFIDAALTDLESLETSANLADAKAASDQAAANDAARAAAATKASAEAKKDAAQKRDAASQSASLAQAADAKRAQADAYFSAALAALEASTTATPATPAQAASSSAANNVCFPVRSRFNVTNVVAASKPASTPSSTATSSSTAAKDATTPTTPSNTQIVSGHFSSNPAFSLFHLFHYHALPLKNGKPDPAKSCGTDGPPVADFDINYDFTADQLSKQDFFRQGFTWGGLAVPYKFYFKDRSIKSNSSIVGFAGYEGWFPGVSLSAVVAAGAGTTPSSSTSGTTTGSTATTTSSSTSTLVTYTVATGLILAFGDSKTVKAGLLFGRDYQGNPAAFAYENKWWMALGIGAGF